MSEYKDPTAPQYFGSLDALLRSTQPDADAWFTTAFTASTPYVQGLPVSLLLEYTRRSLESMRAVERSLFSAEQMELFETYSARQEQFIADLERVTEDHVMFAMYPVNEFTGKHAEEDAEDRSW